MKPEKLLEKVEILECAADLTCDVSGISYDTRNISHGDVFVAIKGFAGDGHAFIPDAAAKGAALIVCTEAPEICVPYVVVKDSRKALAAISAAWFDYPFNKLKMIGVTGTNGKTTVTNLIKNVLEICTGEKVGLIGTNGNMIGNTEIEAALTTPESYELQKLFSQMVEQNCAFCVMEVSSHALALQRVHGITFDVGVFTNLTRDHLDFHGTMQAYAEAKAELFKISKSAAVNTDDEYSQIMKNAAVCPILSYAVNDPGADLIAKELKLSADKAEFLALAVGRLIRVELYIPGLFSVYNALSVLAAVSLLGIDIKKAARALKSCTGVKGRAEVVPTGGNFSIIIDYAHTPDALENILKAARSFTTGRVVALFGCGGDRDKTKRPIMAKVAASFSDFVIVTSDNPRTEEPSAIINDILEGMANAKTPYITIENRREAIKRAISNAQPGDVIVLAGKGHETYQIIGKEKFHFDEREVVAEILREREYK